MATDLSITLHHDAYSELEHAKTWYSKQAEGLGDQFFQEVQFAIAQIQKTPHTWPNYTKGTRRFLVHRFPYAVVYVPTPSKIHILAVMHLKRKPDYWKNRRL